MLVFHPDAAGAPRAGRAMRGGWGVISFRGQIVLSRVSNKREKIYPCEIEVDPPAALLSPADLSAL